MSDEEKKAPKAAQREPEAAPLVNVYTLAKTLGEPAYVAASAIALRGWDASSLATSDQFLAACREALGVSVA